MVIIAGILVVIVFICVGGVIDDKFGTIASTLWFFIGQPISIFAVIWVLTMLGWSGGRGDLDELSCYQNQFGMYCD